MKFIIGVDPGAHGALAIMETNGRLVRLMDMPVVQVQVGKAVKTRISPELLAYDLSWYSGEAHAWVEQVTAMPGQGVSSMFAFGEAFGIVKGALAGNNIKISTVTPANWKKALQLDSGKDASRAKASEMWPAFAGSFKRVKDDGRAEAALLAEYGRQQI
jgi:crossover junction endodeoxyribonuclease RuvC